MFFICGSSCGREKEGIVRSRVTEGRGPDLCGAGGEEDGGKRDYQGGEKRGKQWGIPNIVKFCKKKRELSRKWLEAGVSVSGFLNPYRRLF